MMEKNNISQFMLEMYHMDLASPKERKQVEAALASDAELRRRYEALAESDREIRRRYPAPVPAVKRDVRKPSLFGRGVPVRLGERKRLLVGLGAAAVLICVFFFSFLYLRLNSRNQVKKTAEIAGIPDPNSEEGQFRGTENRDFSIFISSKEGRLQDGTLLRKGDSLELVYTTPPEGEYEGVIFAVDGSPGSGVTPLFPADIRDRPKLSNGRQSLGWYELDAAPDFEMFFLVASKNPLRAEMIIKTANEAIAAGGLSAGEPGRNLDTVKEKIKSAFEGYEVKHSYITK